MIDFLRKNVWAAALLLALRLYVGYTWVSAGLHKMTGGGFDASGFLKGALAKASGENPIVQSWWASFLEHVAIPNAQLFSLVVQWGELLVGIGLIVGGLTRTAAFFGIVMNMSFLLSGSISANPIMIILTLFILVAYTNAGRFGVDQLLFRRLKLTRSHSPQSSTSTSVTS
ncbi:MULTISPECIES: DoxX family protein [Paenibacillus]|uniref:DoxX family protein n=2 Tax=Paenibacillus alvei TaxID=44250 RepID=A0ABT4EGQ7_PAEAL|nr:MULTISPECIES: DoxX family protein [Paenibacillus]MCY9531818.1 DoxX family protein [Paenibacillus alvei]SDG07350.1 thiosulfate dehydrogenase [quinone] large subunit [Paenibacillus sp. cl6col]